MFDLDLGNQQRRTPSQLGHGTFFLDDRKIVEMGREG
jgi:hypothetical protein